MLECLDKPNEKKKKYKSFTIDQLVEFFGDSKFTDYANKPKNNCGALYWCCLIACFHGARQNEIVSLYIDDIITKDGILCFNIQENNELGKTVKNKYSNRVTPVHPTLIKLGFDQYIKFIEAKHGKKSDLFPLLGFNKNNPKDKIPRDRYADKLYKQFNKVIEKFKWRVHGQHVFHSFRHTCKTALKNAEPSIDSQIQAELLGWERKVSKYSSDNYGEDTNAKKLLDNLSRADFNGLDLDHLKVTFAS